MPDEEDNLDDDEEPQIGDTIECRNPGCGGDAVWNGSEYECDCGWCGQADDDDDDDDDR